MYIMIDDFILFEEIASVIHETHQHGIEIPLHVFTKTYIVGRGDWRDGLADKEYHPVLAEDLNPVLNTYISTSQPPVTPAPD